MRCARWGDSRTSISTTGRSTACDLRNHFVLIPLSPDVLAPWIRQLYFAFYFRLGSIRLTYLNGIAFIPRDVWYWRRKVDEKKRIIDYIKGSRPCEARVESSPRVAHVRNPCEFKVLNRVTGARVSVPFPSEREKKKECRTAFTWLRWFVYRALFHVSCVFLTEARSYFIFSMTHRVSPLTRRWRDAIDPGCPPDCRVSKDVLMFGSFRL